MRFIWCRVLLVLIASGVHAEEEAKRKMIDTLAGTGPAMADLRRAARWQGVSVEDMIARAGEPFSEQDYENGEKMLIYKYAGHDAENNYCQYTFVFNKEGEIYHVGVKTVSPSNGSTEDGLCENFPAVVSE